MRRCSAPMLRRRINMQMQLLILRTHMEMTLCLRQCDRRPRRLARCHQASRRRWSRWRRSCHHCPRHHRRRYQHHHRRSAAALRGADSGPAPPPASPPVAVAEAAPAAPRCPLLWPSLRRRRRRRRSLPAAGGGRGGAAYPLPPPAMPAMPTGEATAASSRGTRRASPSSSIVGRGGVGTARAPGTTDRFDALAPSLP